MSTHVRSQEEIAARVKALESILIEKGIMTTAAVDRLVEIYENEVGPQLGAKVVARAWTDPGFRQRLLADATKACADFGIGGLQGEDMVVVDFGYELPDSVEVRVWDSSSEMRYWVLPVRPAGTDALSEAELAGLVTRDSMIGVGPEHDGASRRW